MQFEGAPRAVITGGKDGVSVGVSVGVTQGHQCGSEWGPTYQLPLASFDNKH